MASFFQTFNEFIKDSIDAAQNVDPDAGQPDPSVDPNAGNPSDDPNAGATDEPQATVLQAITLTGDPSGPPSATIAGGGQEQYRAVGSYSDGFTQDITDTVRWGSNSNVVAINLGLACAQAQSGAATITATDAATGVTISLDITVTASDQPPGGNGPESLTKEQIEAIMGRAINVNDLKLRLGLGTATDAELVAYLQRKGITLPAVPPGEVDPFWQLKRSRDTPSGDRQVSDEEFWATVRELAAAKGLTLAGEQTGKQIGKQMARRVVIQLLKEGVEKEVVEKKAAELIAYVSLTGGVIAYAVSLAIDPMADTSLPHVLYQAVVGTGDSAIPVPGADWHRKRENAETDAQAYTAATGQQTSIDDMLSKDPDDPE